VGSAMGRRHERDIVAGVTHPLTMECVDADGATHHVDTSLAYVPSDPYAVTLTFRTAAGDVPWTFGRELMVHGLVSPTGEGDVHVWPTVDGRGRSVLVVELESPDGRLRAQARAEEVCRFLSHSLNLVPLGEERLDVDLLLARLLGG
jgi:hypothetical protein